MPALSVPPAAIRSPKHGYANAVRKTQENSVPIAVPQRKARLRHPRRPASGYANAERPTAADSVRNAEALSPKRRKNINATNAAGNPLIPQILPNSVPNAAILLTMATWYKVCLYISWVLSYMNTAVGN